MKFILAIIMFSLIILFHELGHFSLAKKNGIRVNEFSLGLGPTIFGITKGETKYSLKLLPFGGACMMEGEDAESEEEGAFGSKSVWARIAVVAAGPVFNFIMALVLSLVLVGCIGYDKPVIQEVTEGMPAGEAGLQAGDEIVKINHFKVHFYREVSMYTTFHKGEELTITVKRDGEKKQFHIMPQLDETQGRYMIGIKGLPGRERQNVIETIKGSFYEVRYWIWTTLQSLKMLLTGQVGVDEMSGPVGIVQSIGNTYDASRPDGYFYVFLNMINFAILLSANLGVMNLLPLPALDGGRLVFLFIEAIRGKKVNPDKEGMVHFVGIVLLMALMVFVMFNDIRKLF